MVGEKNTPPKVNPPQANHKTAPEKTGTCLSNSTSHTSEPLGFRWPLLSSHTRSSAHRELSLQWKTAHQPQPPGCRPHIESDVPHSTGVCVSQKAGWVPWPRVNYDRLLYKAWILVSHCLQFWTSIHTACLMSIKTEITNSATAQLGFSVCQCSVQQHVLLHQDINSIIT